MATFGSLRLPKTQSFQSSSFSITSSIYSVGRTLQEIDEQIDHVLTRTRSSAKLAHNDAFYQFSLITDQGHYHKYGHTSNIKQRLHQLLLRKVNFGLIEQVLVHPMRSSYVGAKSLEKDIKAVKRPLQVDRTTVFQINQLYNLALPTTELFYSSDNSSIQKQVDDLLSQHTLKPIELVFN